MKKLVLLLTPCLCLLMASCEKDELPVPAHNPGDVIDNSVEIGSDYLNQIFFSLDNNRVESSNAKTDWDLSFESGSEGYHIFLNSSTGMALSKTDLNQLSETIDPASAEWSWDATSGHRDSTAFGDWRSANNIYLLDRGYDENGEDLGMVLVQPEENPDGNYKLSFRYLDETTIHEIILTKSAIHNRIHASLNGAGSQVYIEPEVESWDLMFTQYTHLFEGPTPYLVTGVLTNTNTIEVALDTTKNFADINREEMDHYQFHSVQNIIGYNWKIYDYYGGVYQIRTNISYLIRKENGVVWKLHFVDFYNDSGERGYPRFEYQEL
jgi:hypothetical protein